VKKLTAFILSFSVYLSSAHPIFAASVNFCPINSVFTPLCTLRLGSVIGPFITLIFILGVLAALLYLVWGGFKWLTSGGDKAAVQSAREHIVAAIVGLVLMFIVYAIMFIILGFFSVNTGTFTLPTIQK